MSYRVLHILDCYLPETMNWLEKTLEESLDECEHHIYASYYICSPNKKFQYVEPFIVSSYPISILSKLKNQLFHSSNSKILLNYILEKKIEIIHFHFGHVAIQYKNWIQKTGLPFCISLYGFDYEYLVHKNTGVKSDYVFLSQIGGMFIVEGNYSSRIVQNYGVPVQQIQIVHMLFDRQIKLTWQTVHSKYAEPIRLVQAATFTEKKNQLGLVQALEDRHASRFEISFFGERTDKYYYKEIEAEIKNKQKHCIRMHDKIPMPQYLENLDNSHFTINLSKHSRSQDTEGGCPVLLKDSLSLGKPVISTNHCDIPELVVHGCNGFLLPENDNRAVTELLDHLLQLSQKEYNKLCSNARESVETNIHQKITRRDLLSVYKSML